MPETINFMETVGCYIYYSFIITPYQLLLKGFFHFFENMVIGTNYFASRNG